MTSSSSPTNTDRGFFDSVTSKIDDITSKIDDSFQKNFAIDIDGIKNAGSECYTSARASSEICVTTSTKAKQLIDYGMEMKTVLAGFDDGINTKDVSTIASLVSGGRVQAALHLASEMDDLALQCIDKSLKMISSIDAGIETLPNILEKHIDKRMDEAKTKGSKEGDPEIPNLECDVRALKDIETAVRGTNPLTAFDDIAKAFDGVIAKGQICDDVFRTIRDFAEDVAGVSADIKDWDLVKLASHGKDLIASIWRCLRLSDLMRSFGEAVKQLIEWIVKVIQAVKEMMESIEMDFTSCRCCASLEEVLKGYGMNVDDFGKLGKTLLGSLANQSSPSTPSSAYPT